MKRNIEIYRYKQLSTDDYIEFAKRAYDEWTIFPVSDVDLIIQYNIEYAHNNCVRISNTETEIIVSAPDINLSNEYLEFIARVQLHCTNFIVAKIRNSKIKNIIVY